MRSKTNVTIDRNEWNSHFGFFFKLMITFCPLSSTFEIKPLIAASRYVCRACRQYCETWIK